jgi:hypothetical protein
LPPPAAVVAIMMARACRSGWVQVERGSSWARVRRAHARALALKAPGSKRAAPAPVWNAHAGQVDVYAFGVLLNEVIGKEPPFAGLGVLDIRNAVLEGKRPDIPLSCPKVGGWVGHGTRPHGARPTRQARSFGRRGLVLLCPRGGWGVWCDQAPWAHRHTHVRIGR